MRNTPTASMTTSPAQCLMGHQKRSLLPTVKSKLEHTSVDSIEEACLKVHKRIRDTKCTGKNLTRFNTGDKVCIQPYSNVLEWEEGNVREWEEGNVV